MSDELRIALHKYIENNRVAYIGEQEQEFNTVINSFQYIKFFDRPDGYSKYDNNVLIIEHFEFDSSRNSKKGSQTRKEEARVDRNFIAPADSKVYIQHDEINCEYSIDNYLNNVIKQFNNHYNKIDSYKENLIKKGVIKGSDNVKVLFCIEDKTVLGNFNELNRNPVILLKCTDFLEVIENCKKLDYILCFSSWGSQNIAYFTCLQFLDVYKRNSRKKDEIKILNLNPQVISSSILLPNEIV